jgi:hypothetical protein
VSSDIPAFISTVAPPSDAKQQEQATDCSQQIIVGCEDAVICTALCTTVSLSIETEASDFTLVKVGLLLACTLLEQCFFGS